jgi:hypothetical protein
MERSTILSAMWNATNDATDPAAKAEELRKRLESGDLVPTGNCRNVERAFWAADEEKEGE